MSVAIEIKEWKWHTLKKKDCIRKKVKCPYCNVIVQAESNTAIVDQETGAIKYSIHKCPECFMPIIISMSGNIIPQSQLLPFEDVKFLPDTIKKLYNECRKCYLNECYHSVVMVSRSLLMHIAVDKGNQPGKSFAEYINYFESEGYIGTKNKDWVDQIRTIGNKYVHQMDEASEEDAQKVILFLKHLLGTIYEMPQI